MWQLPESAGLWTWSTGMDAIRIADAGRHAATVLPDHRARYLDYQGDLRGNRGRVTQVAAGHYVPLCDDRDHFQATIQETTLGPLRQGDRVTIQRNCERDSDPTRYELFIDRG